MYGLGMFPAPSALLLTLGLTYSGVSGAVAQSSDPAPGTVQSVFSRSNLVAWCIVPFDSKKRSPEERAAMLERLGFKLFAYDYRAEHIPTFDAEMEALKRHRVQLLAWWFPGTLDAEAKQILDVLKRHNLRAQLWVTGGGEPTHSPEEQRARVSGEADRISKIARAAEEIGCTVALYNHGNWFGEPSNQIEIIQQLKGRGVRNVGIVYNLHHGHRHLENFPALLEQMKPCLWALNLNGMDNDGETSSRQILPLGRGEWDLHLVKIITASGWRGPIGILNHTDEDAEGRLQDNLAGLDWLVAQLDGSAPGVRPKLRTFRDYWGSKMPRNVRNCLCIKPYPLRARKNSQKRTAAQRAIPTPPGSARTATMAARASPRWIK
jgi:sugar phosphate isomerase/epimerase